MRNSSGSIISPNVACCTAASRVRGGCVVRGACQFRGPVTWCALGPHVPWLEVGVGVKVGMRSLPTKRCSARRGAKF
jgi:hypothetical protein